MMKKLSFLLLFCSILSGRLAAQADTVKKFDNGNLLLKIAGRYEWQEGGKPAGSWDKLLTQYWLMQKSHWLLERTDNGKRKFGLLNMKDGILVFPPVYDNLLSKDTDKGLMLLGRDGKKAFYCLKNNRKTEMIYTGWQEHINGSWMLFDSTGANVYSSELDLKERIKGIGPGNKAFNNGREAFVVVKYKGGESFLDRNNKLYFHDSWKEVLYIHRGWVVMSNGEKTGVYDFTKNKLVIPILYDNHFFMAEMNRLLVRQDSTYALFDTTGKLYTRFIADAVTNHNLMDAIFFRRGGMQNPLWGLMNNKGKVLMAPAWLNMASENANEFSAMEKNRVIARYRFDYVPNTREREIKGITRIPEMNQIPQPGIEPGNTIVEISPSSQNEITEKIYTKLEKDPVLIKEGLSESDFIKREMAAYTSKGGAPLTGTIQYRLVLEKDGTVSKTEVVSSSGKKLVAPSAAIIRQMDRWKPGEQNGQPVRCEKMVILVWGK